MLKIIKNSKIFNKTNKFFNNYPVRKVNIYFQACNLTCPMCSVNVNNKEIGQILRDYPNAETGPQLKIDEYKNVLNVLADSKPSIQIQGGEPTYFPKFVELVEYIRYELNLVVGFTTNGTLLDENKIERLSKCNLGVTISLDGMQEKHDKIRGIGNFKVTSECIERFISKKKNNNGLFVSSLFCIHEDNFDDMERLADFTLNKLKVDTQTMSYYIFKNSESLSLHEKWRINNNLGEEFKIKLQSGGDCSNKDFSKLNTRKIFDSHMKLKEKFGDRINFEPDFKTLDDLDSYFFSHKVMPDYFNYDSCGPSLFSISLVSNGDILFYPQCFEIKLGNIRKTNIKQIWNGKQMKDIRKILKNGLSPVCAHCCANRINKVSPFV